jgi:hypothetical protein
MCTNCEQQQKVWPQWIRCYDHMRMVQGSEIRTRLCYVIRRLHSLSYLYWRCCVCEKQSRLCVVLDMCCNLHNFWTPAPNIQSKKSVFFLIIPPSPVFFICHFVPTTRCFWETMRRTEGRFAVVRYSCTYHCLNASAACMPCGGSGRVRRTTVAK